MSRHGRDRGAGELLGAIGLGAGLGAVGGAYKFAEFVIRLKKLHDVASENAVFARITDRVRSDLEETERLLSVPPVKNAMRRASPEKLKWIQATVRDLSLALEGMGQYTRRVQADVESRGWFGRWWRPSLWHRVRWVLDEREKLVNRRMELAAAHQSLIAVLSYLEPLEQGGGRPADRNERIERVERREYELERERYEPRANRTTIERERVYEEPQDRRFVRDVKWRTDYGPEYDALRKRPVQKEDKFDFEVRLES